MRWRSFIGAASVVIVQNSVVLVWCDVIYLASSTSGGVLSLRNLKMVFYVLVVVRSQHPFLYSERGKLERTSWQFERS